MIGITVLGSLHLGNYQVLGKVTLERKAVEPKP